MVRNYLTSGGLLRNQERSDHNVKHQSSGLCQKTMGPNCSNSRLKDSSMFSAKALYSTLEGPSQPIWRRAVG